MSVSGSVIISFSAWNSTITKITKRIGTIPMIAPAEIRRQCYAEILGVAEEAGPDLIVVGSHRPGMRDYLLGTKASRVVRHASSSVLGARD